jgi:hypothetical protein
MKKKALILLIVFGLSFGLSGCCNWTQAGISLYPKIITSNVGIGTTSPGYKLTVKGAGNEIYSVMSETGDDTVDNLKIQIAPGSGTPTSRIGYLFGNFSNSESGFLIGNLRKAPLRFGVGPGPTERMRIDTNGNVGIGTMNPQEKLDVDGNVIVRGTALEVLGGSGSYIRVGKAAAGYGTTFSYEYDGSMYDTYICNSCGKGTGCDLILDFPYGNVGIGTPNPAEKLHVIGNLCVSGTKSFVQADPMDPTKEIIYTSLEGPEAGTYLRGTAQLVDGEAVVSLPEHFSLVTSDEGLTVQLTPTGEWLQLYVVEKGTKRVIVREANGKNGQFDYIVQGVRKGYEIYQVIRERK